METKKWIPAPRECATMSSVDSTIYVQGGMNSDVQKEVIKLTVGGLTMNEVSFCSPEWEQLNWTSEDTIKGRSRHSSCSFQNKIYTFGGSYMYNNKR